MSEQEIKQIGEIINQSFLRPDEKDVLQKMLDAEGLSVAFFEMANTIFSGALRRCGEIFEEVAQKFDEEELAAVEEYRAKIETLSGELINALANVDITDLATKEKVFDKYYSDKERLNEEYLERLKRVTSQLAMHIIKTAS